MLIVGYDPGGDGAHGVATLSLAAGRTVSVSVQTFPTTEDVIHYCLGLSDIAALGVDTLTCWSTGSAGWRPADRWLRETYREVRNSVMTPNALAGAMGINGMSALIATRAKFPKLTIVETHPKVLYWALTQKKYAYDSTRAAMDQFLGDALTTPVQTANDHEWDAALSAYAAARGLLGDWPHDLHDLPVRRGERLIKPCGHTNYFWPPFPSAG